MAKETPPWSWNILFMWKRLYTPVRAEYNLQTKVQSRTQVPEIEGLHTGKTLGKVAVLCKDLQVGKIPALVLCCLPGIMDLGMQSLGPLSRVFKSTHLPYYKSTLLTYFHYFDYWYHFFFFLRESQLQ